MLGGKSSGVITEASNLLANQNLTAAVEEMGTKAYQKQRDMNDVVPTHRRAQPAQRSAFAGLAVYDPAAEKEQERLERGGGDAAATAAGGDGSGEEDDDELAFLREQRLAQMRRQVTKEAEWRVKQHGTYREISQDDFFNTVVRERGGSDDVVVHFYHDDFERCKVIDRHLTDLAPAFLAAKFVRINVEKSPFIVERLKVTVLPCIVLFHLDVAADRILGFDGIANGDDVDPTALRARIEVGLKMREEK